MHLLFLPVHTTHLLQSLDVSVFKSLKSNFSTACKRYLSNYPGRVITADALATLLGQAWPKSVTPINSMSGFRIYPINAGVISDREMAPSRAFTRPFSNPEVVLNQDNITPELEKLYKKRYEEGYNLYDPRYTQWLGAKKVQ